MNLGTFIEGRRQMWRELESLLDTAQVKGLRHLPHRDTQRLLRLYRIVSSDLILVQSKTANAELLEYLNALVARCYTFLYASRSLDLKSVVRFVAQGFPQTFRKHIVAFLLSFSMFTAGAVFGYAAMALDDRAAPYLMPRDHLKLAPAERVAKEEKGDVAGLGTQAAFSTFLFTHNIQVTFFAFVLGITAGIGTAVVLFINGVMLGALAQRYMADGYGKFFWAWILPHGVPELTAILIAGAAGLLLARGLIVTEDVPRRQSLRNWAAEAVRLILGTIPILVVAGIIEGTISQVHEPVVSYELKLLLATAAFVGLYSFLLFSGRQPGPRVATE